MNCIKKLFYKIDQKCIKSNIKSTNSVDIVSFRYISDLEPDQIETEIDCVDVCIEIVFCIF